MDKKVRALKKALDQFVADYYELPHYGGYNIGANSVSDLDREIARRIKIALEKKRERKLKEQKELDKKDNCPYRIPLNCFPFYYHQNP